MKKQKKSGLNAVLSVIIKVLIAVIVLLVLLIIYGSTLPDQEPAPTPTPEVTDVPEPADFESWIAWAVRKYYGTTIDSITVNDDLGTEKPDDKIALVYFNWDVQNTYETASEVLKVNSDELAAQVRVKFPEMSEFVCFWQSSYLGKTIKYSYEW